MPPGGRYAQIWPVMVHQSERLNWVGVLMLALTASILAGGVRLLHLYRKTMQTARRLREKAGTRREQTLALMIIVEIS